MGFIKTSVTVILIFLIIFTAWKVYSTPSVKEIGKQELKTTMEGLATKAKDTVEGAKEFFKEPPPPVYDPAVTLLIVEEKDLAKYNSPKEVAID